MDRHIKQEVKRFEGFVLVMWLLKKDKLAMRHPARFRSTSFCKIETGLPVKRCNPTYTDIFP